MVLRPAHPPSPRADGDPRQRPDAPGPTQAVFSVNGVPILLSHPGGLERTAGGLPRAMAEREPIRGGTPRSRHVDQWHAAVCNLTTGVAERTARTVGWGSLLHTPPEGRCPVHRDGTYVLAIQINEGKRRSPSTTAPAATTGRPAGRTNPAVSCWNNRRTRLRPVLVPRPLTHGAGTPAALCRHRRAGRR